VLIGRDGLRVLADHDLKVIKCLLILSQPDVRHGPSQPGIEIVGPLPPEIQSVTVFSAGVSSKSAKQEAARALIAYLASAETGDMKRRHGMEPA